MPRAAHGGPAPGPWSTLVKDPWARGSYSYLPVGATPELRRALGTPIGDRLFFAGEATDLGDPGTVHGARASGMRVATQVAATGPLIIGAGMAGLTAAFELSAGRFADRRYRVRLVEARDRLGGRLDSVRPAGLDTYAERGASWVHGIETNELDTLVHEARIDTVPFDYRQATLGLEGRRLPTDYLDEPPMPSSRQPPGPGDRAPIRHSPTPSRPVGSPKRSTKRPWSTT
ncbi:MAG: FAD-dependent oxidoreductase [Candidatus Microthrix sp.]|uniref:FAD-dependent oxidoreductase n=1 Tax=Candidatus Neomicrothrix sp. TaxID=2719034 RepID=UPI0025BBE3AB|nr:FAD-dependent oxidoreductase [Candidatus Microthrix sp.]MBL0203170.1 FAD-dependent oxidoreductase [Candidatus Microthrix sp.]